MINSIPAHQIVNVVPAVLSSGGSDLSMNAVFLTKNANVPTGQYVRFANASDVGDFFGLASDEYKAAGIYFMGFDNSSVKPGNLFFYPYNEGEEAAYMRGASLAQMKLSALKKLSGEITITIDGSVKSNSNIDLSSATSFSNAAEVISTALDGANVSYDAQLKAFEFTSSVSGQASEIGYATGALAEALLLTEKAGAVISNGTTADTPATAMNGLVKATQNWATFTTVWEPSQEDKMAFATWVNEQNQRYLYAAWDTDSGAKTAGNDSCLGAQLKASAYDGTTAIYGGLDKAAFLCGAAASIDFSERQGRITFAFKGQSGLAVDVTNETEANNLIDNGYNFYGAWATANDRFTYFYPGQIAGKWKWLDAYVNQIRINSQLQLALMTLLTTERSLPYNAIGVAKQRAACQDAINEALNFGSIQIGVTLSEAQRANVNTASGIDAATQIEANGYYLYIGQITAQRRGNRQSYPMKLWYTDGGSVQAINLNSIDIQ